MTMNPYLELRDLVCTARRVLLTGPQYADGDSVGATLALAHAVRAVGDAEVVVAADVPYRYAWMTGADEIVANAAVHGDFDVAIVMDGDQYRLAPGVEKAFRSAAKQVVVDHHRTTDLAGYHLAFLDQNAAATCVQVIEILDAWGVALTPDVAEVLYVGLIYDTGGFRYSNTKPQTHHVASRLLATGIDHASIASRVLMEVRPQGMRLKAAISGAAVFWGEGELVLAACSAETMAKCGAEFGDLDGIVESLLYIEGVELSILVVERPGEVKLSLRSRGKIDVAEFAQSLDEGGGGHAKAAGVLLDGGLDAWMKRLPNLALSALSARDGVER